MSDYRVKHLPRNAASIVELRLAGKIAAGDCIVVSFVGSTPIDAPHVFCDPGKRYDWRFARDLHATIVTQRGIDISHVNGDLAEMTMAYPSMVDFERQVVASIVPRSGVPGFKLWPRRRGSDAWQALFG